MANSEATAFCPGHLTGFFHKPETSGDMKRTGSLGSGICLSRGAVSKAVVKPLQESDFKIRITINEKRRKAKVTREALKMMLEFSGKQGFISTKKGLYIEISTTLELPEKSGWGMSGAGALSSIFAVREALELPLGYYETAYFAHAAEIGSSTGLGDVPAQCSGGLTVRKIPGIPPYGFIDKIPVPEKKIVCLSPGKPLSTKSILINRILMEKVNKIGAGCVKSISEEPTFTNFLANSLYFTKKTGLIPESLGNTLNSIKGYGRGGMAMLGNSLFAMGNTENLVDILSEFGRIDVCEIDNTGARVI